MRGLVLEHLKTILKLHPRKTMVNFHMIKKILASEMEKELAGKRVLNLNHKHGRFRKRILPVLLIRL
jgi:hypothetical protein